MSSRSGIEKVAIIFGGIFVCAGGLMIARPYETIIPNLSSTTTYGGMAIDTHLTRNEMRITGIATLSMGVVFAIAGAYRVKNNT